MPKVVVRKSYRCQPGKRREVLTALQRIDAAAATVGYPRGRYLLIETRSVGDPDLEVEFAFETYAEMEQLERRMREHVARFLREGGSSGQEFLLEPSATRYLLLVDEVTGAARSTPMASPTASKAAATTSQARSPTRPTAEGPRPPARVPTAPGGPRQGERPARPAGPGPLGAADLGHPPVGMHGGFEPRVDLANGLDDDGDDGDDPFEGLDDVPEPEIPLAPEIPEGMTPGQFQASQLAKARAALTGAESAVNLQPRQKASEPVPVRPPRSPLKGE
jgi:hypothetical protein